MDYTSIARTNHFHVNHPKAFLQAVKDIPPDISLAYHSRDILDIKEKHGIASSLGLEIETAIGSKEGGTGTFALYLPNGTQDSSEAVIRMLHEHIAENDAAILTETGHEGLRYICATATVITRHAAASLDLADMAAQQACHMLSDPGWATDSTY